MESEPSIRETIEDVGELVLRMAFGGILLLLTLGVPGYFYLKYGAIVPFLSLPVGLLLMAWGGEMLVKAFKEYPKARVLSRLGQEVEGAVEKLYEWEEKEAVKDSTPAFYEVCAYQVGGQTYRVRKQIPEDRFRKIKIGSRVQVRYLPGDPEVAQLRKTRNIPH